MIPHAQVLFGGLMFAVATLVASIFWLMPGWSRPGIFFAVTVAPSFRGSPDAARAVRSYRAQVMAHVAIGFGLILAGALIARGVLLILGTLWLIVGPLVAMAQAHKKALAHAVAHSTIREASLTPRSAQLPGGWALQFGPLAILAIVAVYLGVHWSQIPDEFPVHWGMNGQPNGWSVRTPVGVYGPLLLAAAIVMGISLLGYTFSNAARQLPVPANAPALSDFPHRIAVLLLGVEYFITVMFSLVGLLPLMGSAGAASIVILSVAILVSAAFLGRWMSHGHDHWPHAAGDGTPDACWKLGLVYFNPDDPALFVEKRIGIGYTINFARGTAWAILVLTLILPLGLAAMAIRHH
jgi:uncharacterized membrane protein